MQKKNVLSRVGRDIKKLIFSKNYIGDNVVEINDFLCPDRKLHIEGDFLGVDMAKSRKYEAPSEKETNYSVVINLAIQAG